MSCLPKSGLADERRSPGAGMDRPMRDPDQPPRTSHRIPAARAGADSADAARIPHLVLRLRRSRQHLASDHDVITLDFLGHGASDKPNPYEYSVAESAEVVEDLAAHLHLDSVRLVIHDYGGNVGQELVDRAQAGQLGFTIDSLLVLNSGIVYSAYRPTRLQKLLILPVIGRLLASRVSAARVRSALDAIRGTPLADTEFDDLWLGLSRDNGHKLSHLLIKYNAERAIHHRRWETALANWTGPLDRKSTRLTPVTIRSRMPSSA